MDDLISRQAAIDCVTYDVEHTIECLKALPSAQPDNQINLCDSCDYLYPDCPAKYDDVIFGNGIGNDNICACNKYKPSAQPEKRTEKRTETHACDLIDREAAVDAIYHHLPSVSRTRARTMLHEVPPAQPDQDREFIKLTVRNSNGRPYYSIIYLEVDDNGVGRDFEGYSSYSLDVISDYLKKYFMPSALPETCEGCKHLGKWENEFEYGYPSPCTRCKRRVEDHYER